jgi:hypothetical protein
MLEKLNLKTIAATIVFGGFVSIGTYFFVPLPQNAYAESCNENHIIQRILYCVDGSSLSGGRLTTYCDG